jgi:hypothetical protein
MPQKNKKTKSVKQKAPAKKASKPAGGVGAALKKAASAVAKRVGVAPKEAAKKKPAPAPVKGKAAASAAKKPAAKPAAPAKVVSKKADAPAKGKKGGPAAAPAKAAAAKVQAPKGGDKRKAEVVVEVAASKGAALLTRAEGGKKKTKAELREAANKKRCREPGCELEILLNGFCRMHYIKNWRKIKRKEAIIASGQLNNYVEELVSKYPDKYLDVIRQDLATEKEWSKVVVDLELDSADDDGSGEEDLEGVAENTGRREREFDDDNDAF